MSKTDASPKPPYHHGALKDALIEAGLTELEENGIEAFSLRKVAKRAGVSHAAPAHHFGDVTGLLTALACHGYRLFVTVMKANEPAGRDVASGAGLGYIAFAEAHPALFRLIFSSERPDYDDMALSEASEAAYAYLANLIEAQTGASPFEDRNAFADAMALWAMAHGLADLMSSGRMKPLQAMPRAERRAVLLDLLQRIRPGQKA